MNGLFFEKYALKKRLKRLLFYSIYFLFIFVLLVGTVKLFDLYLQKYRTHVISIDGHSEKPHAFVFNLYPYTGFHLQSNALVHSRKYHIESGDHAFFIDFDLDDPPEKEKDEFRIVLIGGSAAQGWWAATNDDMFYRLLEGKLNDLLKDRPERVRVINLAMGGSATYQNLIMLNKWGHELSPDLIFSFSGFNDLSMGTNDIPYAFDFAMATVDATKYHLSTQWVKTLAHWFPGIFTKTGIGNAIRVLNLAKYSNGASIRYVKRHSGPEYKLGADLYIHALKSIKRDFRGIPIVTAIQPVDFDNNPFYQPLQEKYEQLSQRLSDELSDYYNDDWFFIDIQNDWKSKDLFTSPPQYLKDVCHLNDAGHVVVTELLAPELGRIVLDTTSQETGEEI